VRAAGYSAAFCPVEGSADEDTVRAYADAAKAANIVIAEVGAWSNPMSSDAETRRAALEKCQRQLDLADRIGARCCVNIAGSRGEKWDGHHPDNLTEETFDLIVETVRRIIDAVKPTRSFYTLETMPWMFPDSPDCYLRLIKAIDRETFAVHLDPTNLICSPQRYYGNGALIRECFEKLGAYIKSCHGKDIALHDKFMVHLDEVRPGLGNLDYRMFLRELDKLDPNTPLMLEHLPSEEEYNLAAQYVRSVAEEIGVTIR
jgi:sugar phosphate isomerase/epimerase